MKTIKSIMKIFLASSLLLPFAAQAGPGDCSVELGVGLMSGVELAIINANYLGKRATSDESSLQVKLGSARVKVDKDKILNAVEKLEAISSKASGWTDPLITRKPKLLDATGINTAVGAAIACVNGL